MITRAYKNHNVTFKFERGDYVPDHIGDMVAELAFRADAFDVSEVFAAECWGNAYAVYPLHITANGFTGVYYFGPYDFDAARAGKPYASFVIVRRPRSSCPRSTSTKTRHARTA